MEKLKFNPSNKKYYSEEFIKGFECGVERQYEVDIKEQEPCEYAISRQAVLAIAGDSCLDLNNYEDTREFCDEIKELPSVTQKPKMGRWEYTTHYARRYRVCTECKCEREDDLSTGWNFCPNCGAKMDV